MPLTCKQSNCLVAADSKCLEGFNPTSSCPHAIATTAVGISTADALPTPNQISSHSPELIQELIDLPSGSALTLEETIRITQANLTRLVVLAGDVRSGKTTLLTSIYELLQQGPIDSLQFAGSSTLPGFEERCHLARMASNRSTPETERSNPAQGIRLLHLRLRDSMVQSPCHDLLFTDLTGELFEAARDSTEDCQSLSFLLRADHFTLLLDGLKLTSPETREETIANSMTLLRSCIDAQMLTTRTSVSIAFTKWDLIETTPESIIRAAKYESQFRKIFSPQIGELHFHHIAARPNPKSKLLFGHGIPQLLQSWTATPAKVRPSSQRSEPSACREFSRYHWRPPLANVNSQD